MIDPDTLKSIEDLHRLKGEGIITEEEFERSKERLLFGGKPRSATIASASMFRPGAVDLPADDDHIGWITLPLRRYADFSGRSGRKEFWMFQLLPLAIIVLALLVIGNSDGGLDTPAGMFAGLLVLALVGLMVPLLAVEARRFHDMNRTGWLVLLNLIPYVGSLIVYVVMLFEGTHGENQYGADPTNR